MPHDLITHERPSHFIPTLSMPSYPETYAFPHPSESEPTVHPELYRLPKSLHAMIHQTVSSYLDAHANLSDVASLHQKVIDEVERSLLETVLRRVSGNQAKATTILGINRNTLRMKIKSFGIDSKKFK